jgi:hypothetical protein
LLQRFVNQVLNAAAPSICQFPKPPYHCLIDFV